MRYDLQAVPTVNQKSQFLAKTSSGRLIMKDLGTGICAELNAGGGQARDS